MKTEQLHRDKWYDYIHANHICSVFWFVITLALIGLSLSFTIPIWKFQPVTTTCTILQKNITSYYTANDYISWRSYRVELLVTYPVNDVTFKTMLYGPENQDSFDTATTTGYSISKFSTNTFYEAYQVGQKYTCYYCKYRNLRVNFTTDPNWAALFVLPGLTLLLSICLCVYAPIEKTIREKIMKKKQLEMYNHLEAMQDHYEQDIFNDEEGTYSVLGVGHLPKQNIEQDDEDEWIVQEEKIETVGKFFGIQVEEDGMYTDQPELLLDVADDIELTDMRTDFSDVFRDGASEIMLDESPYEKDMN
jgi:hypothetical protein